MEIAFSETLGQPAAPESG